MINETDYLIIGAGMVGLSVAREIRERHHSAKIIIIEKEDNVALHASGRNSGVLHAGFYYTANSLKAKLTAQGNKSLTDYCLEKGIKINQCGKVVVATTEEEIGGIDELMKRGEVNGINIKGIDERELADLEPNAHTCEKALWSPTTSAVDPKEVCRQLVSDLKVAQVQILFRTRFIKQKDGCATTSSGKIKYKVLINAAGLYADKVAHAFDVGKEYTLLPFKGLYHSYEDSSLVRRHVYPVPNLKNPFLGVHLTKTVDNKVKLGPTAIPVFYREAYSYPKGFSLKEFSQTTYWEALLFLKNSFNFRGLAFEEMKKYWHPYFIRQTKRLLKTFDESKFGKSLKPGIRAQLLNKKERRLEMDFVIRKGERSVHVLNAVSPAFTCAFPFAKLVVDETEKVL